MSTDIFYFTGTGNSLFTAKQLATLISDEVHINNIADFINQKRITTASDCIIFVCPVYFQTIPDIVKTFIKKLDYSTSSPYICGIVTCNGGPGHSLFTINRILKKKGHTLNSGFTIDMPGNSLIVRDFTNSQQIRTSRLEASYQKISKIADTINAKLTGKIEGQDGVKVHLQGMITGIFARYIYKTPTKFRQTEACTKCGVCVRVCPRENIKISKKGIEWGTKCEHCLACFHWCPNHAIEIGLATAGKLRYHHPDIKISDMCERP